MSTLTLGIETSCDETGVAIYDAASNSIVANVLYSQIDLHAEYGGVVPELASRNHQQKIIPLVKKALEIAKVSASDLNAIAYTAGPGLQGALLIGATTAKALGYAWQLPTVAVHHLEGHLLSPLLAPIAPTLPFLALLVSGGHTMLVAVEAIGDYKIIGESIDDAAGEAFDKTAKLLGLPYPGGAKLAQLATKGNPERFNFPRPMCDRPGLDFSFSGLKTHALNTWNNSDKSEQTKADLAKAFEMAAIDTIAIKIRRALECTGYKQVVIAGGVSANLSLREKMQNLQHKLGVKTFFPPMEYCTDNGAMIALAGHYTFLRQQQQGLTEDLTIKTWPRWQLS